MWIQKLAKADCNGRSLFQTFLDLIESFLRRMNNNINKNMPRQGVMFIETNETLVFSLVFHLPKLKPKLIFKLFFRQIDVFNTVFNVPMTQ